MRPSVSTPSQSIKSNLMRAARRSISAISYMNYLTHLEEFDASEFPSTADTLQNKDRRARLFLAQLFRVDDDIRRQAIRVELLCPHDARSPYIRLAADDASDERFQLAGHDQRIKVCFASTL